MWYTGMSETRSQPFCPGICLHVPQHVPRRVLTSLHRYQYGPYPVELKRLPKQEPNFLDQLIKILPFIRYSRTSLNMLTNQHRPAARHASSGRPMSRAHETRLSEQLVRRAMTRWPPRSLCCTLWAYDAPAPRIVPADSKTAYLTVITVSKVPSFYKATALLAGVGHVYNSLLNIFTFTELISLPGIIDPTERAHKLANSADDAMNFPTKSIITRHYRPAGASRVP